MYKKVKYPSTTLNVNQALQGETIEQKIERVTSNKEPIKDGAPLVYTERNEGVKAGYNIRTDRFEVAIDAMDRVQASVQARRENKAKMKVVKDNKVDPTQGTNNGTDNQ